MQYVVNRMDRLTKEQRRSNMQAVKNKGSKIEIMLAKAIWAEGIRYRKNNNSVYGKPDLTIKKYRLAIFADSEFWHGKNWGSTKYNHKSNIKFWLAKIERNIERDKEVNSHLRKAGWIVMRFWGKNIERNTLECVWKIKRKINKLEKHATKTKTGKIIK